MSARAGAAPERRGSWCVVELDYDDDLLWTDLAIERGLTRSQMASLLLMAALSEVRSAGLAPCAPGSLAYPEGDAEGRGNPRKVLVTPSNLSASAESGASAGGAA